MSHPIQAENADEQTEWASEIICNKDPLFTVEKFILSA